MTKYTLSKNVSTTVFINLFSFTQYPSIYVHMHIHIYIYIYIYFICMKKCIKSKNKIATISPLF